MRSTATADSLERIAFPARNIVLEGRNLGKTYGQGERSLNVFQQVDLNLRAGEMVAIVAPSGAGKSTLLHLLATLDTPTSGAIYFESKRIETSDEAALASFRNCAVGFLWQRHQLLPDFTAEENVAMPLLLRGESISTALKKARNWLAEVGLAERASHLAERGDRGSRVLQTAVMRDPPRRLERQPVRRRGLRRPSAHDLLGRHSIEGVVDLDAVQSARVIRQELLFRKALRIEDGPPFLVAET